MPNATLTRNLPDIMADGLFTIEEAVDFSSLCRSSLYDAMDAGFLQYVRVPGLRSRRIPKAALIEWLRGGLVGGQITSDRPAA